MGVQIKELIIKAICGEKNEPTGSSAAPIKTQETSGGKLSFIDECTAEVMERLKRMNEF
jgi:hypothetical protein